MFQTRTLRHNYRRKRAIFDLDSIIGDLMNPWLAWYNQEWNDDLTLEEITTYHIEQHVKPECGWRIFDFFRGPEGTSRYGSIPIFEGAAEGLAKLNDNNVEVIIATATAGSTAPEKYVIAKRAAPWLHRDHVFIGKKKEVLHGDFFIDDAPENMDAYMAEWPDAHVLTIGHPYNQEYRQKVSLFAEDCFNTRPAWEKIVDFILSTP
jgi:5'-nucleotidase